MIDKIEMQDSKIFNRKGTSETHLKGLRVSFLRLDRGRHRAPLFMHTVHVQFRLKTLQYVRVSCGDFPGCCACVELGSSNRQRFSGFADPSRLFFVRSCGTLHGTALAARRWRGCLSSHLFVWPHSTCTVVLAPRRVLIFCPCDGYIFVSRH